MEDLLKNSITNKMLFDYTIYKYNTPHPERPPLPLEPTPVKPLVP